MEEDKVIFYGFGESKIPFSFKLLSDSLQTSITINEEEKKRALYNLTLKDIKNIDNRLSEIINKLKQELMVCNINFDNECNLDELDELLNNLDKLQKHLVIDGNSKVGVFASNKKQKKYDAENKLRLSNEIIKYQAEILSIKNEYDILKKRKDEINVVEEESKNDDALSRTVNFYMSK